MPTGRIEELKDGFIVDITGLSTRPPRRVSLEPTGFRIEPLERRQLELFDDLGHRCNMGRPFKPQTTLVDHRRLVDLVMDQLLPRGYAGPRNNWRRLPGRRGEACRGLAKRIYAQWLRLVSQADPTIRRVQHAVYLQYHKPASLLHEPELYQDKYLVSDICNYPAAATSVLIANELAEVRDYNLSRLRGCPPGQFYFASSTAAAESPGRELAALLANWQGLYSPTGQAYRSLRRTLMQLPSGFPAKLLVYLAEIHLERTIVDRVELLALLLAQNHSPQRAKTPDRLRPFMFATHEQITAGMIAVGRHLDQTLSPRRVRDIASFVSFVMDAPDAPCDLQACVRRAIRWHDEQRWQHALAGQPDPATPTARPRIPLPCRPGVRFLDNVSAIISESLEMKHCIAAYAIHAVQGECYLFHVDFENQHASVEVDPSGRVRQARGPRNSHNRACEYGQWVLRRWGQRLRAVEARL